MPLGSALQPPQNQKNQCLENSPLAVWGALNTGATLQGLSFHFFSLSIATNFTRLLQAVFCTCFGLPSPSSHLYTGIGFTCNI